jgi:hypothetical protein
VRVGIADGVRSGLRLQAANGQYKQDCEICFFH